MSMFALDLSSLAESLRNTRRTLLDLRGSHGHWEGELSSSALSTATAIVALECHANAFEARGEPATKTKIYRERIENGRRWLAAHQNTDGGWGDTTISFSNISTTALVWGALANSDGELFQESQRRCEAWIERYVGSLEPARMARAITDRYGRDRTFSVPILTMLALTGRLGPDSAAWKLIPQLPFELAACPHQWFAWLKLPVVSYALPALISMGQVRHARKPTWNPVARMIRAAVWERTQRVLVNIQPTTGGFLEATPLTSFVVMSLLGAHGTPQEVIDHGVRFLVHSARNDGSWPIDTNLATWTTTLAVNAIDADEAKVPTAPILQWLSEQQYRVEHPYTHAKPGGWAWTELSGGVPDADDTSGALLALGKLSDWKEVDAACAGIDWLLDLQNRDGGIPTFCRGWGALPFDRSSTDITAHGLRAWMAWHDRVPKDLGLRIVRGIERGVHYLNRQQRADGAWAPLWFGNQRATPEENLLYGTSRVLLACAELRRQPQFKHLVPVGTPKAMAWMLKIQNQDGGWGAEAEIPSSIEETSLAVDALAALANAFELSSPIASAIDRGIAYLVKQTQGGTQFPVSPIGFYFAKLWYHERMYPIVYTLAAFERVTKLVAGASST